MAKSYTKVKSKFSFLGARGGGQTVIMKSKIFFDKFSFLERLQTVQFGTHFPNMIIVLCFVGISE